MACGKFLQGQFSIKEVEALAMEVGILLARDMKLTQIIVESNAISIVNSINENFMEGSDVEENRRYSQVRTSRWLVAMTCADGFNYTCQLS